MVEKNITHIDNVGAVVEHFERLYEKGVIKNAIVIAQAKDNQVYVLWSRNLNPYEGLGLMAIGYDFIKETVVQMVNDDVFFGED